MRKLLFHFGGICSMYAFLSGLIQLYLGNYVWGLVWAGLNGYLLGWCYPKRCKELKLLEKDEK